LDHPFYVPVMCYDQSEIPLKYYHNIPSLDNHSNLHYIIST
jgi:hypothetical protein